MEAIRISTERAPAPGGWYSQAYKIGNLIYTAGVTANDPETQKNGCTGGYYRADRADYEEYASYLGGSRVGSCPHH